MPKIYRFPHNGLAGWLRLPWQRFPEKGRLPYLRCVQEIICTSKVSAGNVTIKRRTPNYHLWHTFRPTVRRPVCTVFPLLLILFFRGVLVCYRHIFFSSTLQTYTFIIKLQSFFTFFALHGFWIGLHEEQVRLSANFRNLVLRVFEKRVHSG